MKGKLKFKESLGMVRFSYTLGKHTLEGTVPAVVSKRGEEGVIDYVEDLVAQNKVTWGLKDSVEKDVRKNPIPVSTIYDDGTLLEGRIVEATDSVVRVKLDSPVRGEGKERFEVYPGVAGSFVFDEDYREYQLSQKGRDTAYRALRIAYQKVISRPIKRLVAKLNKRGI